MEMKEETAPLSLILILLALLEAWQRGCVAVAVFCHMRTRGVRQIEPWGEWGGIA